jgi:hypothetical protein
VVLGGPDKGKTGKLIGIMDTGKKGNLIFHGDYQWYMAKI